MIRGVNIELVPAALEDKQCVYDWCCRSETTKAHSGPPDYPENPVDTWEKFFDEGYEDFFFTGAHPEKGRGFIIRHSGEPIGFISYSSFHLKPKHAEIDIWFYREASCGKGYGSEAIISLGAYLNAHLGIKELIIRPSKRNARAIKAYMKAGFEKSEKSPSEYLLDEYMPLYGTGDYGEGGDLLLCKRFGR